MRSITAEQKIYYTLRVATAMCFIGHGMFGIITKPIWCNYFAVFGITENLAYQLMPPLGFLDIVMGLVILFRPVRALFFWLAIWGIRCTCMQLRRALRPARTYRHRLTQFPPLAAAGWPRSFPRSPKTEAGSMGIADRGFYACCGTWLAEPSRKRSYTEPIRLPRL